MRMAFSPSAQLLGPPATPRAWAAPPRPPRPGAAGRRPPPPPPAARRVCFVVWRVYYGAVIKLAGQASVDPSDFVRSAAAHCLLSRRPLQFAPCTNGGYERGDSCRCRSLSLLLASQRPRGGLLKPLGVTCAVSLDTIAWP
jgi:hypothetical protein